MSKNSMNNYMRSELWMDRVLDTIDSWEKIQGIKIPNQIKDSVANFMKGKINKALKKGTLIKMFMQLAVTALLYIKIKRWDGPK